jgi:ribosome-associated protein
MSIRISAQLSIPDNEIVISAVRSQGAGGQNVNKVSSAIHLRFDVRASSLPESCKQRLLSLRDQRVSKDGVIVIKAQQYRTREKNLEAAISRLRDMISPQLTAKTPGPEKPARPQQDAAWKGLRLIANGKYSLKQTEPVGLHKTSGLHRLPGYG